MAPGCVELILDRLIDTLPMGRRWMSVFAAPGRRQTSVR
jgi:hypothetical protein